MKKKIKLYVLILLILGIGISIYSEIYLLTVGLTLTLFYLLFVFFKWKNIKVKNNFLKRTYLASDLILFCFFILMFRMIQLQLFDSTKYREAIDRQVNVVSKSRGERGDIFDSHGKGLAYSINMYDLSVDPKKFIANPEAQDILKELSKKGFIRGNYQALLKSIKKDGFRGRQYKRLNKEVDDIERKEIERVIKEKKLKERNIFFLTGRKERRYYKSDMYFFLVGNTGYKGGNEKEGTFGIEHYYEKYLKGEKSSRTIPSIRKLGIGLPTSGARTEINLNGKDVYLTVDNDLQYILNDAVKKQFEKMKAEKAYAVMMDPNNGKVLATSFFRTDKKDVTNPVFQALIEPGSIFKPLIVASAIERKKIKRYSTFDVGDGTIRKYRHTIKESSRHTKGVLTVEEILKKSSNVGMVLIGDEFTKDEMNDDLRKYGLFEKTGVDYPYEKSSREIATKRWDGLKKSTMSFGQGIVVTPIQMATAFSSVINGGNLYRPYIVEKITDKDGTVIRRNLPHLRRKVLSPEVSKEMRSILEEVVVDGTVHKAKVLGYRIGGKTGTAQYSERGKYVKGEYLSSVVGFFPVDKPKYLVLVMLFKPQGEHWYDKSGGSAAAPVLGEIVQRVTKVKNIYSQIIENIPNKERIKVEKIGVEKEFQEMPDLTGLSARTVMDLFKKRDIKVKVKGIGVVKSQTPKKGTKLEEIKEIEVILK